MSRIRVERLNVRPLLGRHIEHDPRSLAYAVPVLPRSALVPVSWTRRIPILDQGNLGACTGFALTGLFGTDSKGRTGAVSVTVKTAGPFTAGGRTLNNTFGVDAYKLNTQLDSVTGQYPPTDTGSTALGMGKCGQAIGVLSGYNHAFSMQALQTALQTGPVSLGTIWYNSMFDPSTDGFLKVDPASGVAGGHELLITAWDGANYRLTNSWGAGWGKAGAAYITTPELQHLLDRDGDLLVPVYAAAPAPTPSPAPAVDADVKAAWGSLKNWATRNGLA